MLNIPQMVFSQMWTLSIVCMITLFHATNGVTLQDLKNFLHTYQKVWTHTRSFEVGPPQHRHRCIYAEIRLTEHGRYVYAQHYEVDFQWISQLFDAQIFESHKRPVLRIKRRTGKHFYDYTMVFWSPSEHCAVFTFLLNEADTMQKPTGSGVTGQCLVPPLQAIYKGLSSTSSSLGKQLLRLIDVLLNATHFLCRQA
uniref:Lipocalin n=1 Tax=Rhipicephalus appendiculatus TaxID=34631 RepID=A0A131YP76_RHIAP